METTQRTMTVKEILEDIENILSNIDVPASRIEQIGIPIAKSINGIQVCIEAINHEEKKREEQKETEEKDA